VIVNGGPAMTQAGFRNRVNCVFSANADPRSIADAILLLKNDPALGRAIGSGALELFRKNYAEEIIARDFLAKAKRVRP